MAASVARLSRLTKLEVADSPVIEPLGICGLVKLQIVRIERCEELSAGASQVSSVRIFGAAGSIRLCKVENHTGIGAANQV